MSKKARLNIKTFKNIKNHYLLLEKLEQIQKIINIKEYRFYDLIIDEIFKKTILEEDSENIYLKDLALLTKHVRDLYADLEKYEIETEVIGELKEKIIILHKELKIIMHKEKISQRKYEDFSEIIRPLIQYLGKKEFQNFEVERIRRETFNSLISISKSFLRYNNSEMFFTGGNFDSGLIADKILGYLGIAEEIKMFICKTVLKFEISREKPEIIKKNKTNKVNLGFDR